MIVILCAVMLMQALSLPLIHKRHDVLNPNNHFHRIIKALHKKANSTKALDSKIPDSYRIIIEASSTKVKQCFYYIEKKTELLKTVCKDRNGKKFLIKKPIEDIPKKDMHKLIKVTEELTTELRDKLNLAEGEIPEEEHVYVPVDILATAGMRKKTITEQTAIWSDFIEVWENNEVWEKNQKDKLLQLNTIQDTSGVEEGIYGCMIANVALGNLDLKLKRRMGGFLNAPNMAGIVEIGGASAQIAVPTKETTNFNNFKDFYSRSIPFGKEYFLTKYFSGEEMPRSCRFLKNNDENAKANFPRCHQDVSGKIGEKAANVEKTVPLPKEIYGFSHYYLLGGFFENAWSGEVTKSIASIEDLKAWTISKCATGAQWAGKKNGFPEMACYSAVYAYSFLEHFLKGKHFYVGKPFHKHLENNGLVDWPSAAYLYLNSHSMDRPSTEVSVTAIKDDQYSEVPAPSPSI